MHGLQALGVDFIVERGGAEVRSLVRNFVRKPSPSLKASSRLVATADLRSLGGTTSGHSHLPSDRPAALIQRLNDLSGNRASGLFATNQRSELHEIMKSRFEQIYGMWVRRMPIFVK